MATEDLQQDDLVTLQPETPQRRLMDRVNPHYSDGTCKLMQDMRLQLADGHKRMDNIEGKLDANSADTSEVLDILRLGKSFFRVVGYFGAFAKWATAIAAPVLVFWYTIKGGGKA